AGEDGLRSNTLSLHAGVRILVWTQDAAGDVDSRERPFRLRVGHNLGSDGGIGAHGTPAADRSSCDGRVRAERHFVLEQLLRALIVHHKEHEIDLLDARLEPPAAFRELHEYRRAPLLTRTAAH